MSSFDLFHFFSGKRKKIRKKMIANDSAKIETKTQIVHGLWKCALSLQDKMENGKW